MDPSWEVTDCVPLKPKALIAGEGMRRRWQNLVLAVGGMGRSGRVLSAWHPTPTVRRGGGGQGSSSCAGEGGTMQGTRAGPLAYVIHKIPVIGDTSSRS